MASKGRKKGADGLQGDLVKMMYGFGDEKRPRQDSVELLDSMVQEYIFEMCRQAYDTPLGESEVNQQALMFSVCKDATRYARLREILGADQKLKEARDPKLRELADAEEKASAAAAHANPTAGAPAQALPRR